MIIYISGHSYKYELEKLARLFYPFENIVFEEENNNVTDDIYVSAVIEETNGEFVITVSVSAFGKTESRKDEIGLVPPEGQTIENEKERALSCALFECFCSFTGYRPEWGILTGVRPAKLYRSIEKSIGSRTDSFFKEKFLVSEHKLELLKRTAISEDKIISLSKKNSVSIYLSVPFCPSRCSYCSFVSHSVEQAKSLIPHYVELLCREIEITAEIINKLGLNVETVYMGGGTPTTLSAEQLYKVLEHANNNFGGRFREFTVEAGRPDTITFEKLEAIKSCGVGRISINPQTMNDDVLFEVGRRHTSLQTVEAFNMARKVGFDNINMDLIAGLPTDTLDSFKETVSKVVKLAPESVSVHSLSLKRASNIVKNKTEVNNAGETSKMVDYALDVLSGSGIEPYYMYRQSKTLGNLENVGYSIPSRECLYNVYIMDETHSILACGASAVSKLRQPDSTNIERIFNFKYPYEYISRFDELMNRKKRVEEFYNEYVFKDK